MQQLDSLLMLPTLSNEIGGLQLHHEMAQHLLKRILGPSFDGGISAQRLPLVAELWHPTEEWGDKQIAFCALIKQRADALKFFLEMVCSCLIPQKTFTPSFVYSANFAENNQLYTILELVVSADHAEEMSRLRMAFAENRAEICLGLQSSHFASKIIEAKGISIEGKTALIRKQISHLVRHHPERFNQDLLAEMQLLLILCSEEFTSNRESRHLIRIICLHHFFRTSLNREIGENPKKRHLYLKISRAQVKKGSARQTVLSLLVGVNFFMDKEIFDRTHLVKAIQNYIPSVQVVEHSCLANRKGAEQIGILYLEIEKADQELFTNEEITLLRRELPSDLKDCIEQLMHPVFMPRNEEEVIRNMLSLSNQIKYVRDIPQVFISFDEQTALHLYFSVILVRVLKSDALPIQEMFGKADTFLEYIHDRTQNAGSLRRRYRKEATVFRIKLAKDHYLRADHSIDLNRARQVVASELSQIIGEVRDYNGGIISKQNELFSQLNKLLKNSVKYNDLLLENFFYSLTPVIMRSVLEPEVLKTLFLILLEAIEEGLHGKKYAIRFSIEKQFVFAMIATEERTVRDEAYRAVGSLQLHPSKLAFSYVSVYDQIYLGCIYRCDDPAQQELFCETLRHCCQIHHR